MGKISAVLALLMLLGGSALSQSPEQPPKPPAVKAEQQTDGALKAQSNPDSQTNSTADSPAGKMEPAATREAKSQEQPKEGANAASEFWTIWGRPLKITDSLLVGFTFLLFLATVALFFATRDLVEGADKNAEKQLRPYVFLASAKISDAAGTPKIHINIKNFGQTPAYGLSFWTEGILREYPLTSKLERRNSNHTPFVDVGPTGAIESTIDWNGPIQAPDKAALIARTKAIYVFGKVTYRDTFGHNWSTEFQFMEGGEYPFRPDGGELPHTPEGNKAT